MLENAYIRLMPERSNHKGQVVTDTFLGFPTSYADRVETQVIWRKSVIVNDDQKTPIRMIDKNDDEFSDLIISNIDFDFTERIYDVHYFGVADVLAKLGGLSASILPFFTYIVPLMTLHFLYTLAGIISDKMRDLHDQEMISLVKIQLK